MGNEMEAKKKSLLLLSNKDHKTCCFPIYSESCKHYKSTNICKKESKKKSDSLQEGR